MITAAAIFDFALNGGKKFVLVGVIIFMTIIFQKIIGKLISNSFKKSSKFLNVEETKYRFFKHFTSAMIYIIGFGVAVYSIPSLRTISVSLFASAGILAVVIGFASQQAFANIISGMFIVIFKPFRVGDRITIGSDVRGVVEDLNLRHTIIRNFENKRIIVPNSIISNEKIENASIGDEKICKFIEIGISYDSDINKALKIMEKEALRHPLHIDGRSDEQKKKEEPIVKVKVTGFGDSSVNLRAWVWAKDSPDAFNLGCDLNKSIKEKFDKEGIEIPFPYRTIVYKKDLPKNKIANK
jgi:small conductance mechanosensitive channel